MDPSEVEARLAEVGLAETAAAPRGTIRATAAETVDATTTETSRTALPALPRLSIDLRGWTDGAAPGAPIEGADLEVQGLLGEGGMGRVLLARQHSLRRDVALKTPRDPDDPGVCASLLAEGATTGMLEHPAIVPVHALGLDTNGQPAMVMKRIEGVAWSALAADPEHAGWEGWSGDPEDRLPGHLQILVQVCNAVHYAHSRGVVHRDIKLDNVLIGRFGDVYLADWGVAGTLGAPGERLCGTPGYMAPEMVMGGVIDARTDVYLLGATLHEILTGRMRHEGPLVASALLAAARSEPYAYPASLPRGLTQLVNRACHLDRAERPPPWPCARRSRSTWTTGSRPRSPRRPASA
ncbi:MAG: serine/threonine-protein kinase [Sandaracinaceae bacterium]